MSSADLIQDFGQTLTVTRYAAGTYTSGTYGAGSTSTFDVVMAIMPLSEKELLAQPDGERTKRQMKGYTTTLLQTVETSQSDKADLVSYEGISYEVQGVERWEGDLPHYRVRLVEKNV